MKLSILICTMPQRAGLLQVLLAILRPQVKNLLVEILVDDRLDCSIGSKRNALIQMARGEYICFIDDDDGVPAYYIKEILKALDTSPSPDAVGFWGHLYENGVLAGVFSHNHENKSFTQTNMVEYGRPILHINPVRRELVPEFPDVNWGEDTQYGKTLQHRISNAVYINRCMYFYLHQNTTDRSREAKSPIKKRPGYRPMKPGQPGKPIEETQN